MSEREGTVTTGDGHEGRDRDAEPRLREENERLRAELMDLRSRLKEPEDIIRAIRHGEVDAFVVTEAMEEQIYSLRSADVLYRTMIEEMKEGAVALDPTGIVVYCNAYFAQLVGAERRDPWGQSILSFIVDPEPFFSEVLRGTPTGRTERGELTLRSRGGRLIPVFATMNRLRVEDNGVFCLILTDLTEKKRQEELVVADRRKDEFLAMLAHELRNPIAPIRNAAQILRLLDATDSRLRWATDVIDRQVTHMTRLVDDLLDVSRITRGKIRLALEPVEVAVVVAHSVETTRPFIEQRRHELTIDLPPGAMRVHADLTRLSQAISNLLNNAAKFTPEGGRIWLIVHPLGDSIEIVVRDTGAGIAPEILPRVFDLFTQVDSTQERSQGGLGIGLTLARNLIEMHGGTLRASSDGLGRGSEFVVRLPLVSMTESSLEARRDGEPERSLRPAGAGRRILIVDDNVDSAESLEVLLQILGHDVRTAGDGAGAIAEARAFRPEVMFVDIGLPGLSGHDVARTLRGISELGGLVLVAITGYGQDEDRRASRAAGFDHHWVKPIDPTLLSQFLASLPEQPRET